MKLSGLRVLDLSVFLPGPYLTMVMADHGAEVVKIEAPNGGDPGREIGLSDGPSSVFFRNVNRGKKSIVLDLKSEEGREALLELCETADVFVEGFRPGVVDRLGVGYKTVRARNPRIVYCSISAFGQDGPYKDRPAHDLALEAIGGVLSNTLGNDGKPTHPGVAIAGLMAGLHGLSGVLMALYKCQQTGEGDYIDISMQDSVISAMPNILGPVFAESRQPDTKNERTTGGAAFYQIYDTLDGRQVVLAGQEPKFIRALLGALGRPDLVDLCLAGPGAHQAPVIAFLRETFAERTRDEWLQWLSTFDVCYAPVNSIPEAFEDDNLSARRSILVDDQGRRHVAPPTRFSREPSTPDLREPKLGEHTDEILSGLAGKKRQSA